MSMILFRGVAGGNDSARYPVSHVAGEYRTASNGDSWNKSGDRHVTSEDY